MRWRGSSTPSEKERRHGDGAPSAFTLILQAAGNAPTARRRRKSAGRLLDRVLHVARDVVQIALRLVDLAFRAKPIIADRLADGLLHRALGFVGGALHMFLVHLGLQKS